MPAGKDDARLRAAPEALLQEPSLGGREKGRGGQAVFPRALRGEILRPADQFMFFSTPENIILITQNGIMS